MNSMEEAHEMDSGSHHSVDILRYLDDELSADELKTFLVHLSTCQKCRERMEAERALTGLLRESRPLYTAPSALRARVSAVLEHPSVRSRTSQWLYGRVLPALRRSWQGLAQYPSGWAVALPAMLVIIVGLIFLPDVVQHVRAASYVSAATVAHRNYLTGNVPLQIQSDSPEVVTAWFSGRLPFNFRLPSSQQELSGRPIYRLTGASLVTYKGSRAALVTYNTPRREPISLMVTSSQLAVVAGGDEVRSGALTFHYQTDQGFKVITWTNKGLAYALVTDVSSSPRGSCLVCHQSMADRDTFKSAP
jgi:anti-sigma factor RsiW